MPLTGQPPNYTRGYSFRQHSIDQPNVPQPGDKLDQEFDDIATAINDGNTAIQGITNPDGSLKDGIVGYEQLDAGLYASLVDDASADLQPQVDAAQAAATTAVNAASTATAAADAADQSAQDAAGAVETATQTYIQARAFAGQAGDHAQQAAASANEAANSASTAQDAMGVSEDWSERSFKWAEYLAGPVDPAPPGWPEAIDDGRWSSKWWALRAREIVGAWGGLYLGAFDHDPAPVSNDPYPPGSLYFNTVTGQIMVWDGAQWKPMSTPGPSVQKSFVYVATEGQTVFSGVDANGATPAINQGRPEPSDVHVNGVRLVPAPAPDYDYSVDTAASALTIVQPLTAGSVVQWDFQISPAQLAPGAVIAHKVWDIDKDPTTNEAGQMDGVRVTFPLVYIDPADGLKKAFTPGDGVQLMVALDGVMQEFGADFTTAADGITFTDAPYADSRFWGVWYQPGASLDAGGERTDTMLGADVLLADGAQQVVLPAWAPLVFGELAAGTAVALEDATTARLLASGPAIVQVHVNVLHSWGRAVIFGFSMDNEDPVELGRVIVESNEPVSVLKRYGVNLTNGRALHMWISSDFEWQEFAWSGGEIQLLLT